MAGNDWGNDGRHMMDWVRAYIETFGNNVPVWGLPPMTEDELNKAIQKQIELGKPFDVKTDREIKY